MRSTVLRCPFSRGRKSLSGAGLILVLALSACGTTHDVDARSSGPPVPTAAARNALAAASAVPKMAPARFSHARHVAGASVHPGTTSTAVARTARSERTSAAKTTRRPRIKKAKNATSSGVPTAAGLRSALLTTADMPAGYSVEQASGSGLGGSISGCAPLAGNPPGVTAQAAVGLAGPPNNPSVGETLMQLSPADAASAMASYATIPTACSQFTAVVDHYNVTFTTQPLNVGTLGDQTSAVHITGRIPSASQPIYVDFVAIRHGGTVIVLVDVGLSSNTALTTQVAGKAFEKVAARR